MCTGLILLGYDISHIIDFLLGNVLQTPPLKFYPVCLSCRQIETYNIGSSDEGINHYLAYQFWQPMGTKVVQIAEDGSCALSAMLACITHNGHEQHRFKIHDAVYWKAMALEQGLTQLLPVGKLQKS